MPAMVGGFGNFKNSSKSIPIMFNHPLYDKRQINFNVVAQPTPISNPRSP